MKTDKFTPQKGANNVHYLINFANKLEIEHKNLAYEIKNINIYNDFDLCIGYRLHAHIYFLRKNKPSILLNEDGRGKSFSFTLGIPGVDAGERTWINRNLFLRNTLINEVYSKFLGYQKVNKYAVSSLFDYLDEQINNDFQIFARTNNSLKHYLRNMKDFIKNTLP
jgi:polysaccharide pyruvyl transferase WcaK-like protein